MTKAHQRHEGCFSGYSGKQLLFFGMDDFLPKTVNRQLSVADGSGGKFFG
jgi:hypothetical protein